MVLRDVKYVPGFFKIVDEILVNAADNKVSLLRVFLGVYDRARPCYAFDMRCKSTLAIVRLRAHVYARI